MSITNSIIKILVVCLLFPITLLIPSILLKNSSSFSFIIWILYALSIITLVYITIYFPIKFNFPRILPERVILINSLILCLIFLIIFVMALIKVVLIYYDKKMNILGSYLSISFYYTWRYLKYIYLIISILSTITAIVQVKNIDNKYYALNLINCIVSNLTVSIYTMSGLH